MKNLGCYSEAKPAPKGSGETEPAPEGSGEVETVLWGSDEPAVTPLDRPDELIIYNHQSSFFRYSNIGTRQEDWAKILEDVFYLFWRL
jgi:hypothetical protein